MKLRKLVLAAAAVALAAGCGSAAADGDGVLVVDASVPEHALLDDVLAIDAQHSSGGFGFSYVPVTRPDGLRRLTAGTSGASIVDDYQLGEQAVQLLVEFAEQPTGTCKSIKADPGSGLCVRETTLAAAADNTRFRHMTIYVSKVPAGDEVSRFWSRTEMVPVAEAGWWTDLVARAKAAPKRKAG